LKKGLLGQGNGYDVAVINWRGLPDCKLSSPKMYYSYSIDDFIEPITSIYERFIKDQDYKLFCIGFSMGSVVLSNTLSRLIGPNAP